MKTPASIGLPASRFPEWRRGQAEAIRSLLYAQERFNLLCIPTGGGKTVIAAAYLAIENLERGAYLTATNALLDQVDEQLGPSLGIVNVRGRSNYTCDINPDVTAAKGKCTGGVYCENMKYGPCEYYDGLRAAKASRLTSTNYRFWLHAEESGSIGEFDTLILDEAHKVPDEISEFAAVTINESELRRYGLEAPHTGRGLVRWAQYALNIVDAQLQREGSVDRRRQSKDMVRRLARLCRLSDETWIPSRPTRSQWRWDLLDPGALAEDLLFRGARKIILVSASIRRKTLQLLGVDDKVKFIEQSSSFPISRRPIYYWPIAGLSYKTRPEVLDRWHEGIAEITEPRLDRNGLIHSHSFDRGEEIYDRAEPKHKRQMMLHRKGQDGAEVLAEFKERGLTHPTVLISPSVGTGTDFPYRTGEWQIIAKCPYPSLGSPLVKARSKMDSDYIPYVTMQTIVQLAGREMRAQDDQGETFIVDSNFGRLKGQYHHFAPQYFLAAIRTIDRKAKPPLPPPRLGVLPR